MQEQSRETDAAVDSPLVCVVDDDASVRSALSNLLASVGLQVEVFEAAEPFLASSCATTARCLVLDLRMPGMNGSELFARLRASGTLVPCIVLTAVGEDMRDRLLAHGVFAFMTKPFKPAQIVATVQAALRGASAPSVER